MANPDPKLYTVSVGVKRVLGTITPKVQSAAIELKVAESTYNEAARGAATPAKAWDGYNLVLRPGDYIKFDIGDIQFDYPGKAELKVEWKWPSGKAWKDAPKDPGEPAQIPPKAGFASQRLTFRPTVRLKTKLKVPSKLDGGKDETLISMDPDIIIEDC